MGTVLFSQVVLVVKNPLASVGNARDMVSNPLSGRSAGVGIGNPLQYSCLENPMDRGAWWAIVHGVAEELDMIEHTYTCYFQPAMFIFCPLKTISF